MKCVVKSLSQIYTWKSFWQDGLEIELFLPLRGRSCVMPFRWKILLAILIVALLFPSGILPCHLDSTGTSFLCVGGGF